MNQTPNSAFRVPRSALCISVFCFLLSAFAAGAANPTVIFQSELLTGRPYTNIVVQFDPLPITLQSNKFIARASVTFTTDWTGSFTNPIVPGAYRVSLGPYTVFTNCIPDTNATIFATDYVCTAATNGFTSAYTRAQSDLRYPSVAGTNITFTTNAGRVVIHAAASGGSGSDTPHSVTDGATLIATNPVALRFTNAGNITFSLVSNAAGVSISATVDLSVTNDLATLAAATYLTNWINAVSNLANTKQHGSATLTNLSGTGALTNGALYIQNTNGNGYTLTVLSAATTDAALSVNNAPASTNHLVRVRSTNGASALTVTADGKVGVGTNSPARQLDVASTIVVAPGSVTQPGYAFNSLTNYGITAGTGPNRVTIAVAGFEMASMRSDNSVFELRSGGAFGFSSAADTTTAPDTQMYRSAAGTVGFGRTAMTPSGSIAASNVALRGQIEITQTTTTNAASTDSVLLFAANNGGTAELIASDEAGNVVQLTAHPADAPPAFAIVTNWTRSLPRISKTVNLYLGTIEWNNETLAMLLRKWELRGTNISALPQPIRRALADALHEEETFAEYNARTGETLVQSDWKALQDQRQAAWDAARADELLRYNTPLTVTNAAGAVIVLPNDTNVTVRAARDIKKPIPTRLDERVKQERDRKKNK